MAGAHTLAVMAGPVPAIRASTVVRRWPGQARPWRWGCTTRPTDAQC